MGCSQPRLGGERLRACLRPGFLPHPSCKCHPLGSQEDRCHPETGQCPCRPGVEGQACDRCQLGFFGFSIKGCRGEEAGCFPAARRVGSEVSGQEPRGRQPCGREGKIGCRPIF